MGELAFYGASTAMLLFWEERRHDFPVMLTHHVVTICLIAFSYSTRCPPHLQLLTLVELAPATSALQEVHLMLADLMIISRGWRMSTSMMPELMHGGHIFCNSRWAGILKGALRRVFILIARPTLVVQVHSNRVGSHAAARPQ